MTTHSNRKQIIIFYPNDEKLLKFYEKNQNYKLIKLKIFFNHNHKNLNQITTQLNNYTT